MSLAMVTVIAPLSASETDQFTLPVSQNFADLGPEITWWYYEILDQGVSRANARIAEAIARHAAANELAVLQSDDNIVDAVDGVCLRGNDIVDNVERELQTTLLQRRYPQQRIYFREVWHDIYYHAFSIFDPRIVSRFYIGSTIKAFGIYFGTDKFGHFTAIGISYYWSYQTALREGYDQSEALRRAVANGTTGTQSESGIMGLTTTGDYSNADLSANYAGFLFFRNLTSTVLIHGRLRPPLLVRDGPYWRLAAHVRRNSDFFAPFVSDHWNEALNPGWFVESMRPTLKRAVHDRRAIVLHYYADPHVPPSAEYFRNRRRNLETYWGQDYGHRGDDDSLVDIAKCCFGP